MPSPPLLAIVGKKHAGKTTLTVRLASALGRRGWRIGTIKHGSHSFHLDPAQTDTYRHFHEGEAERVAMIAPDRFALVARWSEERSAREVADTHMADMDLVLCEGFKQSDLPKIEVHRRAAHATPLYDAALPHAASWRASVTDDPTCAIPGPRFLLDDPAWCDALCDWVTTTFLPPR
ncbi:MAG: molybdopterin-guanine dinucleotide biosynthesis protein B [Gemmatimonadaceae bacterium]|nr:molybdopterin-guanine dinucleotide biosynthesis protein B [Gemmatimonadaceae bacterium]